MKKTLHTLVTFLCLLAAMLLPASRRSACRITTTAQPVLQPLSKPARSSDTLPAAAHSSNSSPSDSHVDERRAAHSVHRVSSLRLLCDELSLAPSHSVSHARQRRRLSRLASPFVSDPLPDPSRLAAQLRAALSHAAIKTRNPCIASHLAALLTAASVISFPALLPSATSSRRCPTCPAWTCTQMPIPTSRHQDGHVPNRQPLSSKPNSPTPPPAPASNPPPHPSP